MQLLKKHLMWRTTTYMHFIMLKRCRCQRVSRSIGSVGLYVPGGTVVLPSTALMLSVPAHIAGCKTIVLATPPSQDCSICKEVLYCAKKTGVTHILKAGGAQAISAMAWGTESCPKRATSLGSMGSFDSNSMPLNSYSSGSLTDVSEHDQVAGARLIYTMFKPLLLQLAHWLALHHLIHGLVVCTMVKSLQLQQAHRKNGADFHKAFQSAFCQERDENYDGWS